VSTSLKTLKTEQDFKSLFDAYFHVCFEKYTVVFKLHLTGLSRVAYMSETAFKKHCLSKEILSQQRIRHKRSCGIYISPTK